MILLENKTTLSIQLWLTVALIALLGMVFVIYVHTEKEVDLANDLRHRSFILAGELQQSSDNLTRMARTYVVTGNPVFKQYYQDVLDIREGKKSRPENYQNIYWDLVSADGKRPRPDSTQAIALIELMRQTGFTVAEFIKLAEAKANSDTLTATEFEAIRLIEEATSDASSGAEAKRARARRIMHDEKYHQAKAAIMKPIAEFFNMMDKRTSDAVSLAKSKATFFRTLFVCLGLLQLFMLWRSYKLLLITLSGSDDKKKSSNTN